MTDPPIKSVVMSISGEKLNCNDIITYLNHMQIMASISENKSIICNNNICKVENGCKITFNKINKFNLEHKVWNSIKKLNKLSCAHIYAPGNFNGCIYDYLQASKCPNN
mgnify:CR=1 FL=1